MDSEVAKVNFADFMLYDVGCSLSQGCTNQGEQIRTNKDETESERKPSRPRANKSEYGKTQMVLRTLVRFAHPWSKPANLACLNQ